MAAGGTFARGAGRGGCRSYPFTGGRGPSSPPPERHRPARALPQRSPPTEPTANRRNDNGTRCASRRGAAVTGRRAPSLTAETAALASALSSVVAWAAAAVASGRFTVEEVFGRRWAAPDTASLWAEVGVFRDGLGGGRLCACARGLGGADEGGSQCDLWRGDRLPEADVQVGRDSPRPEKGPRGRGAASPTSVVLSPPVESLPLLVGEAAGWAGTGRQERAM